jgi:hypothetical protein
VAFVNARAFEENDRLRSRLELETTYLGEEVREAKALGNIHDVAGLTRYAIAEGIIESDVRLTIT